MDNTVCKRYIPKQIMQSQPTGQVFCDFSDYVNFSDPCQQLCSLIYKPISVLKCGAR